MIALLGLALAALLVASLLAARPAHTATTFTVNSTNDLGDGACDASECTLRDAIETANATSGADVINFNIPGTGVHTIKPNPVALGITDRVTIDGYTQPGSSPNTLAKGTNAMLKIELDGTNGANNGLIIHAGGSGSVVKGLVINRFTNGIQALDSSQNRIESNFIGTDFGGSLTWATERAGYSSWQPTRPPTTPLGVTSQISATSSPATGRLVFQSSPPSAEPRASTGWRAT